MRADTIGSKHPFPWRAEHPAEGRFWAASEVYDAKGVLVASHMRPGIAETVAQAVNQWAYEWFTSAGRRVEVTDAVWTIWPE